MNIEKIVEVIEERMSQLDMHNKKEMSQYYVYECISDLVRLDGWTKNGVKKYITDKLNEHTNIDSEIVAGRKTAYKNILRMINEGN